MSATTAIAIAGLVLAIVSLAWHVYSGRVANATRVRIELCPGKKIITEHSSLAILSVTAVNKSPHEVKVEEIDLRRRRSDKRLTLVSFSTGLGSGLAQLPGKISPRSRATTEVAMAYFEEMGYDLDGPIRVAARLATGKTFYSKWQTLPSEYRKPGEYIET